MGPDSIWSKSSGALAQIVQRIAAAEAAGNFGASATAAARLAQMSGETTAIASLLGREWLLQQLPSHKFSTAKRPPLLSWWPTFHQAVNAILARTPRLKKIGESIGDIVQRGGIAFAAATKIAVVQRVQRLFAAGIRDGLGRADIVKAVRAQTDWSQSYAETAYRTVAVGAYADGVIAQARDSEGVVGFEFSAVMDRDTRPNHAACDGFVARVESPIWSVIRPPLGFNCRCALVPIMYADAARRFGRDGIPMSVRPPVGAGPDKGFKR